MTTVDHAAAAEVTAANKRLVLECMAAMDSPGYLRFLADDAIYEMVGPPSLPLSGIRNKREVEAIATEFFAVMAKPPIPQPFAITAEGERVAVEARSDGQLADGRPYGNRYHFLFEVHDGKITRVVEYVDTLLAKEALYS